MQDGSNAPQSEGRKSSVITKSVQVKRGGRRGIAAQPLYAVPSEAPAGQLTAADFQTSEVVALETDANLALNAIPNLAQVDEAATDATAASQGSATRNSRRKGGRNASQGAVTMTAEQGAASLPATETVPSTEVSASQPTVDSTLAASRARGGRNRGPKQPVPATIPVPDASVAVTPDVQAAPVAETPLAPANRKPSRPRRAVSGGRAEKPAIDTPVIPLSADARPRTQVAAGRMTGSSATLVEATPLVKKPAPKTKAAPAKKAPVAPAPPVAEPEPVASAPEAPKVAKPKKAAAPKAAKPEVVPPKAVPVKTPKPKPKAKAVKKPAKPA